MRRIGLWLIVVVIFVLGCAGLVCLDHACQNLGLILDAIILGGLGGGFTLALIGGESYGLKMPGPADGSAMKLDPGFVGDVFVGLMAGALGIGLACKGKIIDGIFDEHHQPFAETVFIDFGIAYLCGFLGLKFVKSASIKVLGPADFNATKEKVEENEATAVYLTAQDLLRDEQYEAAERLFRRAGTLDAGKSIRGLIGVGRAYKRLHRLQDALEAINQAIAQKDSEPERHRVAVAYWNRACYLTLASADLTRDLQAILSDLHESLRLQPSFKNDLMNDPDLTKLREEPKFKELRG